MKKIIVIIIIMFMISGLLVAPRRAYADEWWNDPAPASSIDSTLKDIESAIGLKVGGQTGDAITFGVVLTTLLPYLYTFGGMILFAMLIWGGFEMLAGAQETKAQEAGKQRITAAAIGFILLFVSYWMAQLLQLILGINILGK